MTSLWFYGGVGEIGGNKILLEDVDTKIWMDFGQGFDLGSDFYFGYLQPRRVAGLRDLFEFDLIPKKKGLYTNECLEGSAIKYVEPEFDGVVISHAHFDHVNHIRFVDPKIPVYTGAGTKLFMEAMEKTSSFANYGEHDYRTFRTGDKIKINHLEIEPIHVDHSIPAAYGFIIHTTEGTVVYTGDFRLHGPKHIMTQEFLESASYSEPAVMISEGTRMELRSKRKNLSEEQVMKGVIEVCREADKKGKLVLYTQGGRDMDRLRTFHTAAEACGRILVISPKTAHLLKRLVEDEKLDLPDPRIDDLIGVYYRRKRSGGYDEKDYYVWEREFLDQQVTLEQLKSKPREYIFNLDFYSFTELIDLRPFPGSHFIYSMSEPFSEEDIEDKVMHNWLNHFQLKYHQLHASGHMNRKELIESIRMVEPRSLFPVHTENPELFKKFFDNVILPCKGIEFSLN